MIDALAALESELGAGGVLGVAARFAPTGETIRYRADETFPTASCIKVAIVHEVFAQGLDLAEAVVVDTPDIVGGSGVLSGLTVPLILPLGDLASLAITVSDNTASNLCLRAVGGPEAVNARLASWGLTGTRIHRPIRFALGPHDPPHTATGTPDDFLALLPKLAREVHARMGFVDDSALLPRLLAVNPYARDLRLDAPALKVRHKPGAVNGVRNDVGVIAAGEKELEVAVFTKGCPDPRWTVENQGSLVVARVARLLADRFLS